MIERLFAQLFVVEPPSARRRALAVAVGYAVIATVSVLDTMTARQLDWSVPYAVCVASVAWYGGTLPGVGAATLVGLLPAISALLVGGPGTRSAALSGIPLGVVLALFAVSLSFLHRSLAEARQLARTDALTGAANSRVFYELAAAELERSRRYGGTFTVAFFDVDDFKHVNDTHGHGTGDEVLKTLVTVLVRGTRATDSLARIGGDEFVLLMPQTDEEAARAVLEKLCRGVMDNLSYSDWSATLSTGAVTFHRAPPDVDEMLRIADDAMYDAKHRGKGTTLLRVFPDRGSSDVVVCLEPNGSAQV